MSTPQDKEQIRAAEKAAEGARLLADGDLEGAIAACTKAIELAPSMAGAHRTRHQAQRRLDVAQEALTRSEDADKAAILFEEKRKKQRIEAVRALLDRICTALRDIGVHARPSREEPDVTETGDFAWGDHELEIAEGPISRVLLSRFFLDGRFNPDSDKDTDWEYSVDCFVPDIRVGAAYRFYSLSLSLSSIRIKAIPIFGPVVGVRWTHSTDPADLGRGVADRLNQDEAVTEAVMRAGIDVRVHTSGDKVGWHLERGDDLNEREVTTWTRARWDCYLAVAQHLLATPLPDG